MLIGKIQKHSIFLEFWDRDVNITACKTKPSALQPLPSLQPGTRHISYQSLQTDFLGSGICQKSKYCSNTKLVVRSNNRWCFGKGCCKLGHCIIDMGTWYQNTYLHSSNLAIQMLTPEIVKYIHISSDIMFQSNKALRLLIGMLSISFYNEKS